MESSNSNGQQFHQYTTKQPPFFPIKCLPVTVIGESL